MKAKTCIYVAIICLFTTMTSVPLWSQLESGELTGTVTDQSGAVVPGAAVTAKNLGTGATRTSTSANNGTYTIPSLPPSRYEVTVQKEGFGPFTSEVQVSVGGNPTLDARLNPSGGSTTVEAVGAGGVQVNTENQEMSQVVNSQEIVQLPTITRNPYDLAQISGNVSPTDVQNRIGGPAGLRGVGVNVNGQREASTDILLDGGQNVDLFTASLGQQVPLDSVQEFRLINSDFTAEYGRATGGVVNVATKSGTNNVHGSIYEFNRISTFASNTYNNSAKDVPKGRFTRNQFGMSLGGPIKKNKLFFFAAGEGTLVRGTAQQINYVPAPAFIAASAPATQQFFNQFGTLTAPISQLVTASQLGVAPGPLLSSLGDIPVFGQVNYTVAAESGGGLPQDTYNLVGRVDYSVSDRTSLFGRYTLYSENDFAGTNSQSPYAGFNTGQTLFNQNAMLSVTHVFSPRVVMNLKGIFNRLNNQQPLGPQGVVPSLYFYPLVSAFEAGNPIALPGYLPFSPGNAIPFGGPQNVSEGFADITWVKGAHTLKFGGSYIYTRDNRVFGAFQSAVEALANNGDEASALDNFLTGRLFQFQGASYPQGKFPCRTVAGSLVDTPECTLNLPVGPPDFSRSNRYNDGNVYAQDSWKVTPRFTLNLGLRWDYYGVQHNKNPNLDSNFYFGPGNNIFTRLANGFVATTPNAPLDCKCLWKPDYNNFAPRVGFALDVMGDGKTSLRGGFGIAYERNFGNVTFNVIQNPPNYAVVSIFSGDPGFPTVPVTTNNFGPLGGSTGTVPLPNTSLRAIDQNIGTSYTYLYNLALQREVARNTIIELGYTGSRGLHQYSIANANQAGAGSIYLGETNVEDLPRLNNQYSNVNQRGNTGFSYYNAGVASLRTSNFMNRGLDLNVNYTYSHAIDNISTTFSENNNNFNLGYLDPFNAALDKGPSDYDIRHRVVVSGIWNVPGFRDQGGFLGRLLGGWQIAPIFEARTGTPFTIWDSTNAAQQIPRWDPGSGVSLGNRSVSNPAPVGPNIFNAYQLPLNPDGTTVGAGNPNDINPLVGISDFGPSCATPASGTVAPCRWPSTMTSRNAFRGPGWWNFTAGVYKNIKLRESLALQLRGEFLNILNHHNYYVNGANTDVGGGIAFVEAQKGGFGNPYDERRNIQLGAKLTF
jgi:outer membrane receptor protein involved in Fe transport